MKISVSNTFDVSTIANTQSFQDLEEFFDYSNKFTSDVVEALTKKLTLNDNFTYTEQLLTVTHGVPINLGQISFSYTLIKSTVPILTYYSYQDSSANYLLTVYFKQAQNALAQSAVWVAGTTTKYFVQNIGNYSIGDSVTFSGFGTATNNGTFLISAIDSANKFLYVQNYKRTSATGDETRTTYAGSAQVKNNITLGLIV